MWGSCSPVSPLPVWRVWQEATVSVLQLTLYPAPEWVGWREATWEPIECLRGMCDAALEAFHRSRAP